MFRIFQPSLFQLFRRAAWQLRDKLSGDDIFKSEPGENEEKYRFFKAEGCRNTRLFQNRQQRKSIFLPFNTEFGIRNHPPASDICFRLLRIPDFTKKEKHFCFSFYITTIKD